MKQQIVPVEYQLTYGESLDSLITEVSGKSSQRQQYRDIIVNDDISLVDPSISTTQQSAVADALTTTSSYWYLALYNVTAKGDHGSPLSDQSNSIHTLTGDNYQPFSLGVCRPDSIRGDNDTRPLALPLLPRANDPATANANITLESGNIDPAIILPGLSRAEIRRNPGNSSQYQLQWVELPQPEFNGSSIGAIVMLPRSESDMTPAQNILLCNLAAGWGTTSLQVQQFAGGVSSVSTCWDSIAEVTALAMNSTPTAALRNTCAGISELHIFQLPVRILAKRDDEEGDGEHLELVFGNQNNSGYGGGGGKKKGEEEEDGKLIMFNRAYGTIPLLRKRGK